jgi:hypothetical protein
MLQTEETDAALKQEIFSNERAAENLQDNRTLFRIVGRLSRMGAWCPELPEFKFKLTRPDETRAIVGLPPSNTLTPEEVLDYYLPECREIVSAAFESCRAKARRSIWNYN